MGGLPCWDRYSAPSNSSRKFISARIITVLHAVPSAQLNDQCANRTVILSPEGKWLPGDGHCSRATPLPMALISNPDCWAVSTATRKGLPRNEGTTTPLSTSKTTVPLPAAACSAGVGWGVVAWARPVPGDCAGGAGVPDAS